MVGKVNFANAVKAFIISDDKLLIVKRRKDDVTRPSTWDVPGGRLEQGENPFSGLEREVKEETNLEVVIKNPLGIHHFTRDDNQRIMMIVFLCEPISKEVILDEENQEYKWVSLDEAKELLHQSFHPEIITYKNYFK